MFYRYTKDYVFVVICDLGIGIPATIPMRHPKLYRFLKLFKSSSDSNLIRGAIKTPSSRTGKPFRGNGLPSIANLAKMIYGSSLTIHSYKGCIHINSKGLSQYDGDEAIPGTLIS